MWTSPLFIFTTWKHKCKLSVMLEISYFKHETTGVNVLQMFFFVADSFPFFARYLITFYCIVLLL